MPDSLQPELARPSRPFREILEWLCIFAVFFVQGAWPTPDVNEPNYLGKALHFWNPNWAQGDFFLGTADAHAVFYWTFGWLALWLPLPALAWVGRLITWLGMAWGWKRLSQSVVPRPWFAVLSAAAFAMGIDRFQMAGEWIFGGVEAKGFAYVFVFFAFAEFVRGRWNLGWTLLGAASAFHVLIGGWTVAAMCIVWMCMGRQRPRFFSMMAGLATGLLLALPGILPVLWMNRGVDPAVVAEANDLVVYFRLWHHLDFAQILDRRPEAVVRFGVLCVFWLFLAIRTISSERLRVPNALAAVAILFAAVGAAISLFHDEDRELAANLLRFYWFRLSDMGVALSVGLSAAWLLDLLLTVDSRQNWRWLAVATTLLGVHLGMMLQKRTDMMPSVVDQGTCNVTWLAACDFVRQSPDIAPNARFITPFKSQTFKWLTGRPEVANWKEMPQDAKSLVEWIDRLKELFAKTPDATDWYFGVAERGQADVERLAKKYDVDYVISFVEPRLKLPVVFENRDFIIYRMKPAERAP